MRDFDYLAPKSVAEALELLARLGSRAIVVAGGTDVLVWMNRREISPEYVVYLGGLDELRHIREEDGYLRVGALVTQAELAKSSLVEEKATALALAARSCAGPAVRNLATIGGNLATATPAGDLILAVAALDGKVKVRGPQGERELWPGRIPRGAAADVADAGRAHHRGGGPDAGKGQSGSGFQKLGRRKAMTISTASAAASVVLSDDGKTFEKVSVVLGSLGATVIHSTSFEEALRGKPAALGEIDKVCYLAGGDAVPAHGPGARARGTGAKWRRCWRREPSKTRSHALPARISRRIGPPRRRRARVSRAPSTP